MAVNNTGGCRRRRAAQAAVPELPPVPQEPVMHRWPHPAGTEAPSEPAEAELHAIGCALTRQTQLLTEIRAGAAGRAGIPMNLPGEGTLLPVFFQNWERNGPPERLIK